MNQNSLVKLKIGLMNSNCLDQLDESEGTVEAGELMNEIMNTEEIDVWVL